MTSKYVKLRKLIVEWDTVQSEKERQKAALSLLEEVTRVLKSKEYNISHHNLLHLFLNKTSSPGFLRALPNDQVRNQWADLAFKCIEVSNYTLLNLFEHRVQTNRYRILFQDITSSVKSQFSYDQVAKHVKELAAVFHNSVAASPRVAIFCDNDIESASCDLACLLYDIFDTPLNTHFNAKILTNIFTRLNINIVVTDTASRLALIDRVRIVSGLKLKIFVTDSNIRTVHSNDYFLGEACKNLNVNAISEILGKRKIFKNNQVITTMFTSGSTGTPKGVSFSNYNLVSKRFGRGAALPDLGENEVMLCYLPLFHTFGRFLEMLGTIYWNGKYVFTGNPSKETLLRLFTRVNPTIFISVPLRWIQLYENIESEIKTRTDKKVHRKITGKVVGKRLKWGLSAAGYLEPKIFRFFQEQGIHLCSGFGMTEATGGITMTPPGKYKNDSVGFPLPGINLRFTKLNELEISGHYIARYLEVAGPEEVIPYPIDPKTDYYLPTGDIFQKDNDGHYKIVDRLKDIYKNNKGQTIAPRSVEQKFSGVPGIKNTFLAGDRKPYNTLLVVLDFDDPFLKSSGEPEHHEKYIHQIITAANKDLAPFERVINFKIIHRDFSRDHGELTPKGSFNRKKIEENFQSDIELLYQSNFVELRNKGMRITIPRWFFRDLGILENDIRFNGESLENISFGTSLVVKKRKEENNYQIGDLTYTIEDKTIDLGLFARQPRLWIGNPSLIEFSPCKEGWDLPLGKVSAQVFLPEKQVKTFPHSNFPILHFVKDQELNFINNLICCSLFSDIETSLSCTRQIGSVFGNYNENIAVVIRRRLEALSRHHDEKIRAQAYQTLLLNDPNHDYSKLLPAFIQSGQPFLTEQSIKEIATREIGKQKLETLRQRLFTYRKQLTWPATTKTRHQFEKLINLLYHFALQNLDYYIPIRAELASWILHDEDPALAHYAKKYFIQLNKHFEETSFSNYPIHEEYDWDKKIRFDPGIISPEKEEIKNILVGTIFIEQSVRLAYDDKTFDLGKVPEKEIWISKLPSSFHYVKYRVSINTFSGKHYDLCLMINHDLAGPAEMRTLYYWAALSGHPYGSLSLPALGCAQPHTGALSVRFMSELTGWDKVREYAGIHYSLGYVNKPNAWKKLITKALKVYFTLWKQSSYKIVPGDISLENVVVPELDYLETATVLSLAGWQTYSTPLSLIRPMILNFYSKTLAHFPWCKKQLKVEWIFDACMEALEEEAHLFLKNLLKELKKEPDLYCEEQNLLEILKRYLSKIRRKTYLPIALFNAADQYKEWERLNPIATPGAREQTIFELTSLYKLYKYPEFVRYNFYRMTYFYKKDQVVKKAFDKLLKTLNQDTQVPAVQLDELSDLQAVLEDENDRLIFSRMVFSRMQNYQKIDLLKIGTEYSKQIVVTTEIIDKPGSHYTIREPIEPAEIGQLYRLFYQENYPKTISEMDKHIVVIDRHNRVIGGLCYIPLENNIVLLDGAAVTTPLKGRGIGTAMINDFSARMAESGVKVIKAHYLHGSFYLKLNFKVDQKWGALVKFL